MDNEQNIINCVRIFADCGVADSPLNANTRALITINSGDSVRLDISLLKNGKLAECSDIASVSVEILDIGALNEALPRTAKLLLSKTVASSAIDTTLTAERFAAGANHFSVSLTSAETALKSAYRYLKICAYDSDGNRTTFAAGWIYIRDILSGELSDDPDTSRTLAEELGAKITVLSSKTDSVSDSLSSLDGEFSAYKTDADSRISAAQTDISGLASSVNSLETSKAQKATSLSGYGIADAYTKTEVDNKNALDLKKASNLSDLPNKATARSNLNVYSKSETYAKTETYSKDELYPKTELYTKTEIDSLSATAQQQKTQLGLSKTPQGFLAFTPLQAWKTQATLAKATKLTSSFSICFAACVGASEWAFYDTADYSALASTWLVQSQASARGFHLAHLKYSNGIRVLRLNVKCRADSTAASHVDLPVSTFSDGKPHAVAFCAAPDSSVSSSGNNGKIRAYVDGVLQASNDAYLAEVPEQNGKLLFMNSLGRVARMCRFNFDISAAGAPYTLADYTSGKAIPAELNAPFNFSADGSTWEPMKMSDNTTPAPATVSVAGDVITITTTAEIGEAFFRIKPTTDIIKGVAGQTLHASVESFSGIGGSNGLGVKPMINDGEVGQINLTTNTKSGTWSLERPFNSVNLTIRYGTSPIPSGTVFTITGLRVWTNGSVVALDDYTFGGKIRDISGNDNHATVSTTNGVRIHGDKDEAVQQMYEAFSAQYTTDNP